jgi:hypothetical protein
VKKTGYYSSRKNPAKKPVIKTPMRKPRRDMISLFIEKKVVLLVRAKPRYLDMVSHFKATCKHRNPI